MAAKSPWFPWSSSPKGQRPTLYLDTRSRRESESSSSRSKSNRQSPAGEGVSTSSTKRLGGSISPGGVPISSSPKTPSSKARAALEMFSRGIAGTLLSSGTLKEVSPVAAILGDESDEDSDEEATKGDDEDDDKVKAEEGAAASRRPEGSSPPNHLVVLVHGFNSRAQHMRYLAKKLAAALGPSSMVHVAKCNQARVPNFIVHPTHDGVDRGGERLAEEIRQVASTPKNKGLHYLSIIGNSMGGLYARYAVGVMYDPGTGLVAGMHPVCYISVATPHLGVCGLLPRVLEQTTGGSKVQLYGGATTRQLIMRDSAPDVGDTAGWGVGSGVKGSTAKEKGGDSRASIFFRMLVGDADEEEATVSPKTPKRSPSWFTRGASGGRLGGLLPLGGTPASSRTPRPADEDEDSDSEGYRYGGAIWEDATPTGNESDQATSPPSPEEAMRPPSREASACYEPLLVRMCKDAAKLRFVSGLAAFEHRVLYGNVCNDFLVRYQTAALSPCNLPGWKKREPISSEYPHVIGDTVEHVYDWPLLDDEHSFLAPGRDTAPYFAGLEREQELRGMMDALNPLGWRRVSARFNRTVSVGRKRHNLPGFLADAGVNAHNAMLVIRPMLDSDGKDTVAHVCSVLLEAQGKYIPQAN